ncbi:lysophospholipid acyltransferase family protein [Granulicella sibirica]|uniref:lysophospholipid acyltransferase family protein n=1 Tax=Granulicella sibirica TaxID=2479048 RepID=UPI0010091156|nr:lysophospholipid acyltransferase family protein [Granulicella sibirica]
MRTLRAVRRTIVLVGVFIYAGTELILTRPKDRVARADWLHRFCARAIKRFGIKVDVIGKPPDKGVLISNHLSYMDIVTFAALHRCVFCSKAEIRTWPVLGWMTTMAGTVYVERGRGGSAVKAAKGMQEASAAGLPVIFFPEGTTSNGEGLLKFHSGLLAQAMASEEPIVPAFIRYHLDQDNGPDVSIADDVSYWGNRDMLAHIFKFLGLKGVRVEVRFAEKPIQFSADVLHRKVAADEARVAVARVGGIRV